MRSLALVLLGACFLGGKSSERLKTGSPHGATSARDAKACAFAPTEIVAGEGNATAVNLVGNGIEVTLPLTASADGLMATLPPNLAPGAYALQLNQDGLVAEPSTLTIISDTAICGLLYTPILTAMGAVKSINLSWNTSAAAQIYEVWSTSDPTVPFSLLATAKTSSFTESALAEGATRFYKVKLKGSVGTFDSNSVSATTVPPPVKNVRIVSSPRGLSFSWALSVGARSYTIERSTNERTYEQVATVDSFLTELTGIAAEPALFRVSALNLAGHSAPSIAAPGRFVAAAPLALCQRSLAAAATGIVLLDSSSIGNSDSIERRTFDTTRLDSPSSGIVITPDGSAWFGRRAGMTGYYARGNEAVLLGAFALRETSGEPRTPQRAGWARAYDALSDTFVFAGSPPGVAGGRQSLYAVPRLLLSEPSAVHERNQQLTHAAHYMAIRTIQRELIIAEDRGTDSAVYIYDADDFDAPAKRTITGAATLLTFPRDLAYDEKNDEIVVLDNNRLLRFAANAGGNTAPRWQTPGLVEAIAVHDGALFGMRTPHDGIHVWQQSVNNGETPSDTFTMPSAVSMMTDTRLAFDVTSGRFWIAGTRNSLPYAAAVLPTGPSGSLVSISSTDDATSRAKFSARCAQSDSSTLALDASSASFRLAFFETETLFAQAKAWTGVVAGSGVANLASTFVFSKTSNEVILAGTNNDAGIYRDFVAAVPVAASGPLVTSSRTWQSSASVGSNGTKTQLAVVGGEVLMWRERGPSIDILPLATLAEPIPSASVTDAAATGVLALAAQPSTGLVFALRSGEIRVYSRDANLLVYEGAISNPSLAGATDIVVQNDALFVSSSEGKVLVFPANAQGETSPANVLTGSRTGLVGASGSPRFFSEEH